jgi:hypothetical protein
MGQGFQGEEEGMGWDLLNLWIDPWLDLDQQTSNLTTTTLPPLLHLFVFACFVISLFLSSQFWLNILGLV